MTTKLQKVSCRTCIHRKVKLLNNSVIWKDIELKLTIKTNFGPLSSKSNIKLGFDVIVMLLSFYCLGLFTDKNTNMTSL